MASGSFGIEGAAYGTDSDKVEAFLNEIHSECIVKLTSELQNTEELFGKLRENWAGKAESKFEENFEKTISELIKQIRKAGEDLETEIQDVSVAMRKMDADLIN